MEKDLHDKPKVMIFNLLLIVLLLHLCFYEPLLSLFNFLERGKLQENIVCK